MPALNFSAQFTDAVASGKKRQTIRQPRKHPIKPGDLLYLYTGMRTKNCRKLGTTLCARVDSVCIQDARLTVNYGTVGGVGREIEALRDGFEDWQAMREWFRARYGLPFEGVRIQWEQMPEVKHG